MVENLVVASSDSLKSLAGLENIHPESVEAFWLVNNPALVDCSYLNICNILQKPTFLALFNNGMGCGTIEEIVAACDDQRNNIDYTIFYDVNENKIQDPEESAHPDGEVMITANTLTKTIISKNLGRVFMEDGNYTIAFNPSSLPDWKLTTDSLAYHIELGAAQKSVDLKFGVTPRTSITDATTVINATEVVCGTEAIFNVTAKNIGTTNLSGTLWFLIDDILTDRRYIDVPDTLQGRLIGWHFSGLEAGQTLTKLLI